PRRRSRSRRRGTWSWLAPSGWANLRRGSTRPPPMAPPENRILVRNPDYSPLLNARSSRSRSLPPRPPGPRHPRQKRQVGDEHRGVPRLPRDARPVGGAGPGHGPSPQAGEQRHERGAGQDGEQLLHAASLLDSPRPPGPHALRRRPDGSAIRVEEHDQL